MMQGFKVGFGLLRRGETISPDISDDQAAKVVVGLRRQMDGLASRQRTPSDVTVRATVIGGVASERVTAAGADPDRTVLHLHGGAYIMCSPATHRGMAITLSRAARAEVVVPDYRLAPEHPFPAALDDARAVYEALLDEVGAENIAVSGDSAGGGLALALLLDLRDRGIALPACAAVMSPWTDLTGSGDSIITRAHRDPWLTAELVPVPARAYAGETPLDDPLVSPLHGDHAGLPPMLVHVGSEEIIRDDSTRLVASVRAAGGSADLTEFTGMWHVFQAFGATPEAQRSFREIGGYIRRHTTVRRAT